MNCSYDCEESSLLKFVGEFHARRSLAFEAPDEADGGQPEGLEGGAEERDQVGILEGDGQPLAQGVPPRGLDEASETGGKLGRCYTHFNFVRSMKLRNL